MGEASLEQGLAGWEDSKHKIKRNGSSEKRKYSVTICLPHYSFHSLRIEAIRVICVLLAVLYTRSPSIKRSSIDTE